MTTNIGISSPRCTKPLISKCVSIYNEVVAQVYKRKLKPNTLQQPLDDDNWRFNVLPGQLPPINKDTSLTKQDLTRLVRWKITHGVYRPFLPAQVQKNDDATVQEITAATAKILLKLNDTNEATDECILTALKEVTKLKGVGPATGSLVLSVLAPDKVVFFQDELFGWLFPEHGKLKYDVKEYRMLLGKCEGLMGKLKVKAWELEKAAYVIMHFDVLDEEQRRDLVDLAGGEDDDGNEKEAEAEDAHEDVDGDDWQKKKSMGSSQRGASSAKAKPSTKPAKRTAPPPSNTNTRRSKRRKE